MISLSSFVFPPLKKDSSSSTSERTPGGGFRACFGSVTRDVLSKDDDEEEDADAVEIPPVDAPLLF